MSNKGAILSSQSYRQFLLHKNLGHFVEVPKLLSELDDRIINNESISYKGARVTYYTWGALISFTISSLPAVLFYPSAPLTSILISFGISLFLALIVIIFRKKAINKIAASSKYEMYRKHVKSLESEKESILDRATRNRRRFEPTSSAGVIACFEDVILSPDFVGAHSLPIRKEYITASVYGSGNEVDIYDYCVLVSDLRKNFNNNLMNKCHFAEELKPSTLEQLTLQIADVLMGAPESATGYEDVRRLMCSLGNYAVESLFSTTVDDSPSSILTNDLTEKHLIARNLFAAGVNEYADEYNKHVAKYKNI